MTLFNAVLAACMPNLCTCKGHGSSNSSSAIQDRTSLAWRVRPQVLRMTQVQPVQQAADIAELVAAVVPDSRISSTHSLLGASCL